MRHAYHHKPGIPSLSGLSKKKELDLGTEHGVEYIELPISVKRRESAEGTDMVEYLWVNFEQDAMGGTIAGREHLDGSI